VSRLDLVAGPNGAGKSTFVRHVLADQQPGSPFVNPDELARQRWPDDPESHAYEAAQVAEATRTALIERGEQFITETSRLVNEQKATVIVEHLAYDPLDDRYDASIFTENQTAQDLTKAGGKLKKSVYEYVVTDSNIERSFVEMLDVSDEVVVYSRLPRGFFIPTPVGDYHPDWAIAFVEGKVKHVYFVAETKGSMSTLQLKGIEKAKIECARKFFASLSERAERAGVKYDVVDSYDSLLSLVMA